MTKKGVDDAEEWKKLNIVREHVEQLYEEKLLAV